MLRFGGWFGRLLYRLEWALNQRLLILPSHALCSRCRWAFHRSELTDGLCPGCDALAYLEEEERRIQEEVDAAWDEYERERREYLDAQPCSLCGHPVGHHYADGCDDCPEGYSCGDPDYDPELDPEEVTEVWFTEPPGGHHGYE